VLAYLRTDASERTLFVVVGHFSGATREYRIGVPRRGLWREIINSNSQYYGGTGLGNDGARHSEDIAHDGYTQSLNLTLPPLTTTIFKWTAEG